AKDLFRLERFDQERRAGLLPDPGAEPGDRVRAAAGRPRSHSHDLSRSDERLRREAGRAVEVTKSSRRIVAAPGVLALAIGLTLSARVEAHRLDEYLQATLVTVGEDRVDLQIDLTPGVSVARQVLEWIDTDRNGEISTSEADRYASDVVGSIVLKVDG